MATRWAKWLLAVLMAGVASTGWALDVSGHGSRAPIDGAVEPCCEFLKDTDAIDVGRGSTGPVDVVKDDPTIGVGTGRTQYKFFRFTENVGPGCTLTLYSYENAVVVPVRPGASVLSENYAPEETTRTNYLLFPSILVLDGNRGVLANYRHIHMTRRTYDAMDDDRPGAYMATIPCTAGMRYMVVYSEPSDLGKRFLIAKVAARDTMAMAGRIPVFMHWDGFDLVEVGASTGKLRIEYADKEDEPPYQAAAIIGAYRDATGQWPSDDGALKSFLAEHQGKFGKFTGTVRYMETKPGEIDMLIKSSTDLLSGTMGHLTAGDGSFEQPSYTLYIDGGIPLFESAKFYKEGAADTVNITSNTN